MSKMEEDKTTKKKPNKLIVEEATADDNSVIGLHSTTMDTLELFRGDTVMIRGKRRKDTVCIVLADDTCPEGRVRMNKVVRKNLRVHLGDMVLLHQCKDIKYGQRVHLLPVDDTIEGVTGDLFETFLQGLCS